MSDVGRPSLLFGDIPSHHAARKPAEVPALIYPNGMLTWRDLDRHAASLATALANAGVGKGDTVTISLPNAPLFHEACFAAWKLGATVNPISTKLSEYEFDEILKLANPRALVGGRASYRGSALRLYPDANLYALPPYTGKSQSAECYKAMHSGGSTGRPKLIVDHGPSVYTERMEAACQLLQVPTDGVVLNTGPLHHNAPFLFSLYALSRGNIAVGMERFDAEKTLQLIESYKVDWVMLVPTMMHRILMLPRAIRDHYDLSSLKTVMHGAAPCAPWLKREWIDWLGGERIFEIYGGTEAAGISVIRGDEWLEKPGSVGRMLGVDVNIVGENGQLLGRGEVGEIYTYRPDTPSHYVGDKERRTKNGWVSIGDFGWLDADGYLFIADRRTDLILRGGANIYPAEIEAAIEAFPDIACAVAIGVPCEDLGQRVHAIIEVAAEKEINVPDLHKFLGTRLASYKLPASYDFVRETLRDDAGKVRRSAMRDERVQWLRSGASCGILPDGMPFQIHGQSDRG